MSVASRIRALLVQYISDTLSLEDLTERFVLLLFEAADTHIPETQDLAANVDLLLIEQSNGDFSEDELRARLSPLLLERPYVQTHASTPSVSVEMAEPGLAWLSRITAELNLPQVGTEPTQHLSAIA